MTFTYLLAEICEEGRFLLCKCVECTWKWNKHITCNSATKRHLFDSANFTFRHWHQSFQIELLNKLCGRAWRENNLRRTIGVVLILPSTIFVRKNGVGWWTRLSGNRQIVYYLYALNVVSSLDHKSYCTKCFYKSISSSVKIY